MNLRERLAAMKAGSAERIPAEARAIMERATEELRRSPALHRAIKVGDTLPDFSLINQGGEVIRNTELLREGPLVISFFRGLWCPYCRAELDALEAAADDFRRLGARLVLISPQNRAAAEDTRSKHDLSFDVLTDPGNGYARQLGLVFTLPEDLREVYRGFGIDLPVVNEDDSWTLPVPARLVVDRVGIVRDADINPDYTVRPDPAETLAALHKLRTAA